MSQEGNEGRGQGYSDLRQLPGISVVNYHNIEQIPHLPDLERDLRRVTRREERLRNNQLAMRLGITSNPIAFHPYVRHPIDINRINPPPLRPRTSRSDPEMESAVAARQGGNQAGRGRYGRTVRDIRRLHQINSSPELSRNFKRIADGNDVPLSSGPARVMNVISFLNDKAQEEANRNRREDADVADNLSADLRMDYDDVDD